MPLFTTVVPHGNAPTDHRDMAELLISHGANINVTVANHHCGSNLYQAALSGSADVFELLLENGADLYATDDHGWTVLHFITKTYDKEGQIEEKKLRIIQFLVSRGIDTGGLTNGGCMARAIAETASETRRP